MNFFNSVNSFWMNLWGYIWISSFLLLMLSYTLDPLPLSCAKANVNMHSPVTPLRKLLCYCPCLFTVMHALTPLYILAYWCRVYLSLCMSTDSPLLPYDLSVSTCMHSLLIPILLSMATCMHWSLLKTANNNEVYDFAWLYLRHTCVCMHWIHICVQYPSMLGH